MLATPASTSTRLGTMSGAAAENMRLRRLQLQVVGGCDNNKDGNTGNKAAAAEADLDRPTIELYSVPARRGGGGPSSTLEYHVHLRRVTGSYTGVTHVTGVHRSYTHIPRGGGRGTAGGRLPASPRCPLRSGGQSPPWFSRFEIDLFPRKYASLCPH